MATISVRSDLDRAERRTRTHPNRDSHARLTRRKSTAATDSADAVVVHWPEPSRLESWWNSVMQPARG